MDGNQPRQALTKDFSDPFNAGQMVGMLAMMTFLEKNKELPLATIDKLKWICANNSSGFLNKPAEDVFLFIDNLVEEIQI